MRRILVLGCALALVATACGWARPRYDAGNSGNNPFESKISVATVATLTKQFTAASATSGVAPGFVVSRGHLYVDGSPMRVFDASGANGCGGTPRVCSPQWSLDGPGVADVQDSAVYSPAVNGGASGYDADGVGNCSGVPKVCHARWVEQVALPIATVTDPLALHFVTVRFNAHGSEGVVLYGYQKGCGSGVCSTCFQICNEQWSAPLGSGANGGVVGGPAVANGVVYVSYSPVGAPTATLSAFDGTHGVGAATLWTASLDGVAGPAVAVGDGIVVVPVNAPAGSRLEAFDAAGQSGCSGTPKVCTPLWQTDTQLSRADAAPALSHGVVYRSVGDELLTYPADGTGCSGSPKVCSPRWAAFVGAGASPPAVADGLVFIGSAIGGSVLAYDVNGVTNCSASTHQCSPLWSATVGGQATSVEVWDGRVYVGGTDGTVTVFGLP